MPTPYEAVYGGTKAFLISFAEAVKAEIKDSGVTITLLLPGEVDTPFWHRAGMDTSKLGMGEKVAPTKVAEECYQAMKAGKDRVVAGKPGSKFIGNVINNLAPDTVKADLHAAGAEPGSGRKNKPYAAHAVRPCSAGAWMRPSGLVPWWPAWRPPTRSTPTQPPGQSRNRQRQHRARWTG